MYLYFLLFSCNESTLYKQPTYEPNILVIENEIVFEDKNVFENPHEDYFTIVNTGNDVLIGYIESRSEFITIEESFEIEPGDFENIVVNFNPETENTYNTHLDIYSNDPDEPQVVFRVLANGIAPVLDIFSDRYLFDDVNLGCTDTEKLYIGNSGSVDLIVDSILQFSSLPEDITSEINLANNGGLPWDLGPGEYRDIDINYQPSDFQDDESRIIVDSNDPLNPSKEVGHNGTSIQGDIIVDEYVQVENLAIDILFVVDDSGSMNPFQNSILQNIDIFLNVLMSSYIEYNIAFITTTHSQPVGTVINKSMPNPLTEALDQLSSIGIFGSGHEKGLDKAHQSLNDPIHLGYGSGFLRENAALAIVFLSDEDDFSIHQTSFYESFFLSLKPYREMVSAHSIVGGPPSGCSNAGLNATFGSRYYDVAINLGGNLYDICTPDWGNQMQNLAWNIVYRGNFDLSEDNPIESTIIVYNNGVIQTDWTYDQSSNSITFGSGSIPVDGDLISIEYSVYEECN